MKHLLVFTDLDGTLLDHHSYSYAPARDAIERLRTLGIPLIFNSSKTQAEIRALRRRLDNAHPYVVENGAAVCVPPKYFPGFPAAEHVEFLGPAREGLMECLARLRERRGYLFKGFSDYSDAELASETGLPVAAAGLAKMRVASEPVRWLDTPAALHRFEADLRDSGLNLLRGGRFYHVMGQTDKADAMAWLVGQYRKAQPNVEFVTVALGDSANDKRMLEAADIPVVIPAAHGTPLTLDDAHGAIYPRDKGPVGWQSAMERVFEAIF